MQERLDGMERKHNFFYIQAARGVAVLLVMLFHASQTGQHYFGYNYLGISEMGRSGAYTFFFALTGYLMFTLYRDQFGRTELFGTFLLKRFYRIYPLYWLMTAAVVPIYFLVPSFGFGYERNPGVIFKSMLLWPQAQAPILGVAWSLTYVVWFYLMFSLVFLLKEKTVAAIYSGWLTIIALNEIGWIQVKSGLLEQFLFSEAHLEFFAGMLVAYLVRKRSLGRSLWWIAGGATVYAILWVLRFEQAGLRYTDLLHTFGSALVLVGVTTWKGPAYRWLKPLALCGNASYSILLASLPMMSVTFKLARAAHAVERIGPALTVTLCFLSGLLLCLAVYRWVERPLNALTKKAVQARSRRKAPEAYSRAT
ncbi:acyltransferase [Paenibacillus tyrfis]|uniref:acyltransferase family protein n=1 Tax=Paenibacillus tyrfis TaxID=1501230 RepID=UPI0024936D64|nr:acyltransferase [Paenibacillus tyrfis]GLI04143.1 acyltransferase [Paenibacillus tyrfis]